MNQAEGLFFSKNVIDSGDQINSTEYREKEPHYITTPSVPSCRPLGPTEKLSATKLPSDSMILIYLYSIVQLASATVFHCTTTLAFRDWLADLSLWTTTLVS